MFALEKGVFALETQDSIIIFDEGVFGFSHRRDDVRDRGVRELIERRRVRHVGALHFLHLARGCGINNGVLK